MATQGEAVNANIHWGLNVSGSTPKLPSADSSEALGVAGLNESLEVWK